MAINERAKAIVDIDGQGAEQQLNEINDAAEKVRKELNEMAQAETFDPKTYANKKKQLNELERSQRKVKKTSVDVNRVMKDLNKTSFNDLLKTEKKIRNEMKKVGGETKAEIKRQEELAKRYQKVDRAIKDKKQSLFGARKESNKLVSSAKGLLPAFGFAAIAAGVGRLISKWARWQEQLVKTRHQIQSLTGETGSMLDELTAKVSATSKVFDKNFDEIATAANSVSKQMNVSFGQAMELIQDGFVAGADSSGEFLSMLKEYPTQLKQIGLDANQAVALMTQQVKEGVFSDKGIDAIKEAGIRLREMPKTTQEAIKGIGLTVDQVQRVIGDEGIIGGIKLISERLNQLEDNSPEVGAALADIFAGPGEDAGIEYLRTLKDINTNMDALIDDSSEYASMQDHLVEANERVSESMMAVFGKGNVWTAMKLQFKTSIAEILETMRSVPFTINRVGKKINDLIGKKLFNVKDLKEYQDVLFQINPTFRDLSDQVKKFGAQTKKGKAAMDELAKVLINTYGKEGQELAISFMKAHTGVAKEIEEKVKKSNKITQEEYEKMLSSMDGAHLKRTLRLEQQLAKQKITQEEYNIDMLMEEESFLQSKLALQERAGKKTIETERKLAKKEQEINELRNQDTVYFRKEMQNMELKSFENIREEIDKIDEKNKEKLIQNYREWSQKMDQLEKERNQKAQQKLQQQLDTTQHMATQMGQIIGESVVEMHQAGEKSKEILKEAGEQMLIVLLEQLKKFVRMQIVKATVGSLASAESIATFGAAGLAKAAVLTGLIEAAFAGVKSAVLSDSGSGGSSTKVPQRASGNLDVIGEDDGRTYRDVPYQGSVRGVGIANGGRPTLINEQGGELIADAKTTDNILRFDPGLFDAIKSYQAPQRAEGNLPETTGGYAELRQSIDMMNQNNARLDDTVKGLREQLRKGINLSARQAKEELNKLDKMDQNTSV